MGWDWNDEKTRRWLEPAAGMEQLLQRWQALGFRTLLDRGCGPGRHAVYFAQGGFQVTGMDFEPSALRYLECWASQEGLPIQTVLGDMMAMPFLENTFDCIVDYNVSYHTDTAGYFRAVEELRRVLRPGGEAFLTLKSQKDPAFLTAEPEAHLDRFTLCRQGQTPHFYARSEEFSEIFSGFSLVEPPKEVRAPGIDSPAESVHYHLLLRKEETTA